jgi:hypothetical protein
MWSNDGYADQPNPDAGGGYPGVGSPVAVAPPMGMPGPGSQVAVMAPHTASAPGSLAPAMAPSGGGALDGALDVPQSLSERIELCKFLAGANLLPSALRGSPANVLLIMHKAMALQIPLSVAIEHLHVIDGKVGHSAELLRALLHRHGHVLRWPTSTDKEVVGELVLRHDQRNPRRAKFTMIDASRMELTNKKNWKLDPESMLIARCTTRLVSRHCPEVAVALGNLSAVDFEDIDAEPVKASAEVDDRAKQAADLYAEARAVSSVEELKGIGGRAKDAGLLEVAVLGDTTLQEALLQRIDEISKARNDKAEPAGKPAPKTGRAGGGE